MKIKVWVVVVTEHWPDEGYDSTNVLSVHTVEELARQAGKAWSRENHGDYDLFEQELDIEVNT